MKHSIQWLKEKLDQILDLLGQGSFLSFTVRERQSLRAEAQNLSQKLSSIENRFLTIGLLGGTGVGKSTLLNALAGSEIAAANHRRPYTDYVLIYRHVAANPIPATSFTGVAWREITHEADSTRQVLLCDLPDFDSFMGEHREHVVRFMEHLDVLVWVTSPEKYADGRFYEFLQVAPKANQNFYFVLNKVDLFFHGESLETGYEQMARVAGSFQEHIKEHGISEPLLCFLSAEEAIHPGQLNPWNQFPSFKQQLFQQRDMEQIKAVKAANLHVEVQQLLSVFQKEVLKLESFERILESSVKKLRKQRLPWLKAGQEAIDLWLDKQTTQDMLFHEDDPSHRAGPGYRLATLMHEGQEQFGKKKNVASAPSPFVVPPEEIALCFQKKLEWLEDQLNHRILRQGLPPSFRQRLQEILDVPKTFEKLREHFSRTVALRVGKPAFPPFLGRFKALQSFYKKKVIDSLKMELGRVWKKTLDSTLDDLNRFKEHIQSQIHTDLFTPPPLFFLLTILA